MPREGNVPERGTVLPKTTGVVFSVSYGEHRGSREWMLLSFGLAVLVCLSDRLCISKREKRQRYL